MQPRFTKTFVYHEWYKRPPGGDPTTWQKLVYNDDSAQSLDQQIASWVRLTGNIIIHPGQLGIHTEWYDRELTLRCVVYGLTVLFVEGTNDARNRSGPEEEATAREWLTPVQPTDEPVVNHPGGSKLILQSASNRTGSDYLTATQSTSPGAASAGTAEFTCPACGAPQQRAAEWLICDQGHVAPFPRDPGT